ncbi:MAG: glycoside hydrolase family 2 sugar binding protein [Glaciihabitans sp.]|nr:glycoside hydrolase family 2 sugar binding protein [Glaciihabitans sp.]
MPIDERIIHESTGCDDAPGRMKRESGQPRWETDDPDYPRPMLQRPFWMNLNGQWKFHFDDEGTARRPADIVTWDRVINVPFSPESQRSGIADQNFHSDVWYSRDFEVVPDPGNRVHLHFGAVDYDARVWVNDVYVGSHEGGHTPFTLDITQALSDSPLQCVSVWAHDNPQDLAKPRGKQDWQREPHSIWYPRTTGIWQTVWLEELSTHHIDRITWTVHLQRWEVNYEAFIAGSDTGKIELSVRLTAGERVLAEDHYLVLDKRLHRRIAFSDPGIDDYRNELLWSPEQPTLIDAEFKLFVDGLLVDEVRSYAALRGVTLQRGRFLLNNRPYPLRLVLDQGYWPESLMTPPSEEAIIHDIQLVKAAGFNGVRKHQKIEDPRFLYWADRMGLLVWEEMPSAYRFTHLSIERTVREWMEVIDRDSNHPCIVVWVPFNESWGVPDLPDNESHRNAVQALYHLTRTLDPSRPVIGNDGWESSATDILGIHDYDDDPERILARYGEGNDRLHDVLVNGWPGGRILTLEGHPHEGQPVMLTEFGGIAHSEHRNSEVQPWGYSVSGSREELQLRYETLMSVVNRIKAISGFCYTQLTDTFQEANGLFFDDRSPKFDLSAMRRATMGRALVPSEVIVPPLGDA